uniref:Uncharacterized protein n=1 Tax=Ditylum brightwellii TaxID=49249 RepID=A0A7S2EQH7_9STRA|mmetsp:Transcript_39960/g.60001  ORF Transcript_39960/g.60001 Transcript_39960/m.60001 type:complete len:109 (+) Transcript_39960:1182-1508(+)
MDFVCGTLQRYFFDTALDTAHATPADAFLPLLMHSFSSRFVYLNKQRFQAAISGVITKWQSSKTAVEMHKIVSTAFAVMTEQQAIVIKCTRFNKMNTHLSSKVAMGCV